MKTTSRSTHLVKQIKANPAKVYQTLISAEDLPKWKVPDGMTLQIHHFEAKEGGSFRISLSYDSADQQGKTSGHTDTYQGHFAKLVPNEKIVEIDEFETADPALKGRMKITITLADRHGNTELTAVHEDLPEGVSLEDNEAGWRMSLEKLAALVEESGRPI